MWHFIGWLILFLYVISIEEKINKLCEAHTVVCVEEKSR
jgi:hypothetical protein